MEALLKVALCRVIKHITFSHSLCTIADPKLRIATQFLLSVSFAAGVHFIDMSGVTTVPPSRFSHCFTVPIVNDNIYNIQGTDFTGVISTTDPAVRLDSAPFPIHINDDDGREHFASSSAAHCLTLLSLPISVPLSLSLSPSPSLSPYLPPSPLFPLPPFPSSSHSIRFPDHLLSVGIHRL